MESVATFVQSAAASPSDHGFSLRTRSRQYEENPSTGCRSRLAVLLVLVHNTNKYPSLHLGLISDNGWMGVDLFFVLSGFLITRILLDTKQSECYFRNFYARRCLRIWPLYYSVLLFMFVIVPFLRPSEAHAVFEARSSPWWAFPVFLQNFLVSIPAMATGPLGVTWSLAVEEQFYLFWPLVVRFCNETQLRKIAIAVICLSPALRFYLSLHQVNIYSNTFCRLDGLMAGALLALVIRSVSFSPAVLLTERGSHFLSRSRSLLRSKRRSMHSGLFSL